MNRRFLVKFVLFLILIINICIYGASDDVNDCNEQGVTAEQDKEAGEAGGEAAAVKKAWSAEAKGWALGCAGVLNERNHARHDTLLPCDKTEKNIKSWIKGLDEWWGINSREDLLDSLKRLKIGGHRKSFSRLGKKVRALSDKEYNEVVQVLKTKEEYKDRLNEIKIVRQYYKKLGRKGILGWDYSRYICLCRWGCVVGYITEEEAWEKIMPIAEVLQKKFNSWRSLGKNYLIGRRFWSYKETLEDSHLYEEAYNRLIEMRSSPWNKYAWDTDLSLQPIVAEPNEPVQ